MIEGHLEFWPARLSSTLTLPETSVPYNLEVSAYRYPGKTAIVYYGTGISYARLYDEVKSLAGYLQEDLGVREATGSSCTCRTVRSSSSPTTPYCGRAPSSSP